MMIRLKDNLRATRQYVISITTLISLRANISPCHEMRTCPALCIFNEPTDLEIKLIVTRYHGVMGLKAARRLDGGIVWSTEQERYPIIGEIYSLTNGL